MKQPIYIAETDELAEWRGYSTTKLVAKRLRSELEQQRTHLFSLCQMTDDAVVRSSAALVTNLERLLEVMEGSNGRTSDE